MKTPKELNKFVTIVTLSIGALISSVNASFAYNPNSVPSYCQRSAPWGSKTLGYGPGTIADWGCFLTCIGDETQFFYGGNWNPGNMDSWMLNNGGFRGNLVIPAAAPGYIGWNNYSNTSANLGYINALLDCGYLVIAETRWPSNRSLTHYVLLTAHSGNTYAISDPWYGDRVTFQSRYGDPARWIYSIYVFAHIYTA